VDPSHRYPPEWFGDDGKVHLRKSWVPLEVSFIDHNARKHPDV
jgi:hypothetical protein